TRDGAKPSLFFETGCSLVGDTVFFRCRRAPEKDNQCHRLQPDSTTRFHALRAETTCCRIRALAHSLDIEMRPPNFRIAARDLQWYKTSNEWVGSDKAGGAQKL